MALSMPDFRPRPPWWGPDLQTLRNALRARAVEVSSARERRLRLPVADGSGDALSGLVNDPDSDADGPLIVLIHGLSGCEESAYMRFSARHWLSRGHRVLRLNLRGAGPSRADCRFQYHAGRSEDLRDALRVIEPALLAHGLVLIGYSLGGNMLLKFLAEFGRDFPILAGASISAPIDLAAASRRLMAPRNRLYHMHLLRSMKSEALGEGARLSPEERTRVGGVRSIYEFDDRFVAPRNGYRDAEHYYAENHARRFLSGIAVPTLLIHALDDPWIPGEVYRDYPWSGNPHLHPLLPRRGGHVGFHDRTRQSTWFDRCIARFLADGAGCG